MRALDAERSCPFVGETLRILKQELNNEAALLGFVGAPYTLASYIVEGGSSKHYTHVKQLAFSQPQVLHALLKVLTGNVIEYCKYQVNGLIELPQMCFVNGTLGQERRTSDSGFRFLGFHFVSPRF